MIFPIVRDLLAVFLLDDRLGKMRERYIEETLAGRPPGQDYWTRCESEIVADIKRRYYTQPVRAVVKPSEAQTVDDRADYDGRTQVSVEEAIWQAHRCIKQIPFVGQAEHKDP
jgi:hypothetical protein